MKNKLNGFWDGFFTALLGIIATPVIMICGVVRWWRWVFCNAGHCVRDLLRYGHYGCFCRQVEVYLKLGDTIYTGDSWDIPKAVGRMAVCSFDVQDNMLKIKVRRNEKLLKKMIEEQAEAEREENEKV